MKIIPSRFAAGSLIAGFALSLAACDGPREEAMEDRAEEMQTDDGEMGSMGGDMTGESDALEQSADDDTETM